jgi:hypothetical protein
MDFNALPGLQLAVFERNGRISVRIRRLPNAPARGPVPDRAMQPGRVEDHLWVTTYELVNLALRFLALIPVSFLNSADQLLGVAFGTSDVVVG